MDYFETQNKLIQLWLYERLFIGIKDNDYKYRNIKLL